MAEIKERPTTASASPRGAPIDKLVFGVAATLSVAFVLVGAIWPEETSERATSVLGWVTGNFGWLFVLTSCGFVIFSAYLALSRYGNIKLGPDDSEPEFSTVSWVSMMFATGMGIGLMFWGVAEPLTHFNAPPLGEATPGSPRAAELAMQYSFFHWGLHPWAMYAVIGLAIGYFAYRKGYGNLISATFRPLLGEKVTQGPGRAIDVVAIFATLFGSATSLGLGALQITGGLDNVFGSGAGSKTLAVIVIAVLTGCFVISAVSGVERGIKYLSNANALAAALLAFFLFVVGPTVFILSTFTQSMGAYLDPAARDVLHHRRLRGAGVLLAERLDDLLLGLVDLVDPLRRDVHRPDLQGPHDQAVRDLRRAGAEPGVVRLVRDPGRDRARPAAGRGLGASVDRHGRHRAGGVAVRGAAGVPARVDHGGAGRLPDRHLLRDRAPTRPPS